MIEANPVGNQEWINRTSGSLTKSRSTLLMVMRQYLEEHGYTVITAALALMIQLRLLSYSDWASRWERAEPDPTGKSGLKNQITVDPLVCW